MRECIKHVHFDEEWIKQGDSDQRVPRNRRSGQGLNPRSADAGLFWSLPSS